MFSILNLFRKRTPKAYSLLTLREDLERFTLPLSKSALARALAALGLSRKKSR